MTLPVPQPEILFLVHRAPWPPDRGDRIRSWHLFQALCKLGPVHVAALADSHADVATARAKLQPLAASVFVVRRTANRASAMLNALVRNQPASVRLFHSAALAHHVGGLIRHGNIGAIVAFSSQMAQYIPPHRQFGGPVVMDFVDVDSAKFSAYAAADRFGTMRWVNAREGRLLAKWESEVAQRARTSLFVSEAEAALFRSRTGFDAARVRVLENGIDLDRFDPATSFAAVADSSGPLVVFTGQMDYRPNVEAVTDFARNIMPLLQARHPAASFAIVGRAPTAEIRKLAGLRGVIVTGEVPDTRPWLAAATVVVAPLTVARGVQNKLLEAMAMARPVVTSPSAAQGVDATPGTHLLVANGAAATADAIAGLIADPARAAAMGRAARLRMRQRYGWGATLAPLAAILGIAA